MDDPSEMESNSLGSDSSEDMAEGRDNQNQSAAKLTQQDIGQADPELVSACIVFLLWCRCYIYIEGKVFFPVGGMFIQNVCFICHNNVLHR